MNNNINKNRSFYITRTAILLAFALAVQFTLLRMFPGNPVIVYIVGSIINMILFLAAMNIGLWSGVLISVITPLVALMTGHLPLAILLPFVAIANVIIVVAFLLISKIFKAKQLDIIIGGVVASVLKFAAMYFSATLLLPLISSIPAPVVTKLSATWSIPQLVTALIGLSLAITLTKSLKKTHILEMPNN